MKKRVAVIGAGLCGSLLSTLLRNEFDVTVIEQGKRKRPLFDDVECDSGELNTSINRAEGLGGTTNYWHNALIELDDKDLRKAGIEPRGFEKYYAKGWNFFLSEDEVAECNRARDANAKSVEHNKCTVGHMVLPQSRANVWKLANSKYPGADIKVVYGHAEKVVKGENGGRGHMLVNSENGTQRVEADYFLFCGGGLGTPVLLAKSFGKDSSFVSGYHDHPMAYVAKVKLREGSRLKAISCTTTKSTEVRAGLVYESEDLKTVVYLRPAIDMRLSSITGAARYILSDLRNDPFSIKKIMLLLGNLEAVREAILFKTKLGFRGEYFSVLILGEQTPIASRGVQLRPGRKPTLNWHVTKEELASYENSVNQFFDEFGADILEKKLLPTNEWNFRNAAHHSGTANEYVDMPGDTSLEFFAVKDLPNAFVLDGSILRAAGIANSGLTLVALGYRLAELLKAQR